MKSENEISKIDLALSIVLGMALVLSRIVVLYSEVLRNQAMMVMLFVLGHYILGTETKATRLIMGGIACGMGILSAIAVTLRYFDPDFLFYWEILHQWQFVVFALAIGVMTLYPPNLNRPSKDEYNSAVYVTLGAIAMSAAYDYFSGSYMSTTTAISILACVLFTPFALTYRKNFGLLALVLGVTMFFTSYYETANGWGHPVILWWSGYAVLYLAIGYFLLWPLRKRSR